MTDRKSLSVGVTAETLFHLNRMAAVNGWGEKDLGRVIDKLTKEAVSKVSEQEVTNYFAIAIVRWRKRLGMNVKAFADYIGISENTIHNYEKGRCLPNLYTAMQIAEKLGTTVDGLINGD